MKYSKRILKAVELLNNGSVLADIGCDHGYVCILSIQSGKFSRAYACDVAQGPLSRAKDNIKAQGLEDRVKLILSDGFNKVPSDVDCTVICGMGGLLIKRLLTEGLSDHNKINQLVLGPHSELFELREYLLSETEFGIYRETTLFEYGKFYTLFDIRKKSEIETENLCIYLSDISKTYGCIDNQTDKNTYIKYLTHELGLLKTALTKVQSGKGVRAFEKKIAFEKRMEALQTIINESGEFT